MNDFLGHRIRDAQLLHHFAHMRATGRFSGSCMNHRPCVQHGLAKFLLGGNIRLRRAFLHDHACADDAERRAAVVAQFAVLGITIEHGHRHDQHVDFFACSKLFAQGGQYVIDEDDFVSGLLFEFRRELHEDFLRRTAAHNPDLARRYRHTGHHKRAECDQTRNRLHRGSTHQSLKLSSVPG